jgi:DNA-directed RNA polymerase specialized sigma24 family protein
MLERKTWRLARQAMTTSQYEVFVMHCRDGLSQRAIALALGISRQAVRDRLATGARRMAAHLNRQAV